MAISCSIELSWYALSVYRMRDTCFILTAEIVEVVDSWRHVCSVLLLYLAILNDVECCIWSDCSKSLEVLSAEISCLWAEDNALVKTISLAL